jgi:16S rRNA (cytosine1402-N4)-methyltransferase
MTGIKNNFHKSVLLKIAIEALCVKKDQWYVDCTLGGGGHSLEILRFGGKVLGIDQDMQAILKATSRIQKEFDKDRYVLKKSNFSKLAQICSEYEIKPKGILFDLGVSSYQIDGNGRGFSFQVDEELDMRMDPDTHSAKAKDLVNGLYEKELGELIRKYGEDPLAHKIAHLIVEQRKFALIETTGQLAQIIEQIYRQKYHSKSTTSPATKTFQALRIAVNDEVNALESGLAQVINILDKNGRVVVISFHGLEDKIVKQTFKKWQEESLGQILTKKPTYPSEAEISDNPRARSAKLRVFEKN